MISHQYRCIFVHLRRTGGNSIEHALGGIKLFDRHGQPTKDWDDALHRGKQEFKRDERGHRMHSTASQIKQLHPEEFGQYFKFTVVRNPWDQVVSLYRRHLIQEHRRMTLAQWLKSDLFRKHVGKGTVPRLSLYNKKGRCMVDFVARFESLQRDFDQICDRISIPRIELPKHNVSSRGYYASYYDPESVALIADLYAEDIVEFGYQFDG